MPPRSLAHLPCHQFCHGYSEFVAVCLSSVPTHPDAPVCFGEAWLRNLWSLVTLTPKKQQVTTLPQCIVEHATEDARKCLVTQWDWVYGPEIDPCLKSAKDNQITRRALFFCIMYFHLSNLSKIYCYCSSLTHHMRQFAAAVLLVKRSTLLEELVSLRQAAMDWARSKLTSVSCLCWARRRCAFRT